MTLTTVSCLLIWNSWDPFRLKAVASYLNSVRVIVKEGCEEQYLDKVRTWVRPDGMTANHLARIGERRYCFVGFWESEEALIAGRSNMIDHLNSVRDDLEEISPELGVTDPVSGPVVISQG